MNDGPKARIYYDFFHPWDINKSHRIIGFTEMKNIESAKAVTKILNESHGEGTHWVDEIGTEGEHANASLHTTF